MSSDLEKACSAKESIFIQVLQQVFEEYKEEFKVEPSDTGHLSCSSNQKASCEEADDSDLEILPQTPPTSANVAKWSAQDVLIWIESNDYGGSIASCRGAWISADIDGVTILQMDEEQLKVVGVTASLHRHKIMEAVSQLKLLMSTL